jgi:hypothetical protein
MTDTDSTFSSPAEGNQNGEQNSNVNSTDATLQSTLEALNKRLDAIEAHQKTAQSGKDRGINAVQKEQQALKAEFAEVKTYLDKYPDPADAERFYNMDQFLANAQQGAPQVQNQGMEADPVAGQAANASDETAKFLDQLGVDQTSADYLANLQRGMTSEQAALAVLAQGSGNSQEGSASGVSGGQGSGNVSTQQEVLQSQYNQELDTLQKQNGGYLSPEMLYTTKEKFAKMGLKGVDYF